MNTEPREPSRLPVRGTLSLLGTVGALALLLSFRGAPSIGEIVFAEDDRAEATDELLGATATETSGADVVTGPITLTGDLIETRWGDVQVTATLEGGDVTDVRSLVLPDGDSRSARISEYVGPILREEAIAIDTADVSVISGATYTSEAYALSLQSALDQVADDTTASLGVEAPLAEVAAEPETLDTEPTPAAVESEPVTVTGDVVSIRWGDVQVAITVHGDDIVAVETLAVPMGDRRSERINARAEPVLREEAIAIDSADVSVISGATYTSRAYAASLQSALDQLAL